MSSTGLVGRREQLAMLEAAAQLAQAGDPQVVVVSGAAGVGRTRLLTHFLGQQETAGSRVLRTTCVELGTQGLPLAPLTAALRQLARQLDDEALAGLPEHGGVTEKAVIFDLFRALLQRLGSERPVVLAIDDFHWADSSSRELVGYLARTLRPSRVLLVIAYRADNLGRRDPLRPFLAELGRLSNVQRLSLVSFSRAETTEVLAGSGLTAADFDRVCRRSAGNAFFALELAKAGSSQVPDSLRDLLQGSIELLPDRTRFVLRRAAIGGRSISHALLSAAAGLPENELLGALRPALDARILVPDGNNYTFRHELLRDAVADDMLPAERAQLHRAYAQALAADPGLTTADRYPAELALHWYRADEPAAALPALLVAAEAAARIHAYSEQAQLLSYAVDLWPRVREADQELLAHYEKAASAALAGGETFLALDLIDRAMQSASRDAEPEQMAMLYAHRGMALHHLDRAGPLTEVDEALRLLPLDSPNRARVLDYLAGLLALRGHPDQALGLAEETVSLSGDDRDLRTTTTISLGWVQAQLGSYEQALTTLKQAQAQAGDDALKSTRLQLNLARALNGWGDFAAAEQAARAGIRSLRLPGFSRDLEAVLDVTLIQALTATGQWDEAVATATRALEKAPPGPFAALLHVARGEIAMNRADFSGAAADSAAASGYLGVEDRPWAVPVLRLAGELTEPGVIDTISDIKGAQLPDVWALLVVASHESHFPEVRARLREVAAGLRSDTPLLTAYAAELEAELSGRADADWAAVVGLWDAVGEVFRGAYARIRAGYAASAVGDRPAAVEFLLAARATADALGARLLLTEIETLVRAHRLRIRSLDSEPQFGLTAREIEVLRLVCDGGSNSEIGRQLYATAETVSEHMSSILVKMHVNNRSQAAAIARRQRLFE